MDKNYDELVQRLRDWADTHSFSAVPRAAADAIVQLQARVAELEAWLAAARLLIRDDAKWVQENESLRADLAAARALLNEAQGFVVPDTAWDYTTDAGGYLYDRIERALAGKDAT